MDYTSILRAVRNSYEDCGMISSYISNEAYLVKLVQCRKVPNLRGMMGAGKRGICFFVKWNWSIFETSPN